MRYRHVPGSSEAHEADATRCPVCRLHYGRVVQPTVVEPRRPPEAPARAPYGPHELADGSGQALSTGRLAVANGWQVTPAYYRAADGLEASALSMARGEIVIDALWTAPGEGVSWSADVAYAWQRGQPGTMRRIGFPALRAFLKTPAGTPLPAVERVDDVERPAQMIEIEKTPKNVWLASGEPLTAVRRR